MSSYLSNPTRKNIRQACLWLLDRRKGKNDEDILNRFFQFKDGEDRARHIQRLKGDKADKFVPIINFLKERVQKTSPENIELISWLIDFQPRPYEEYLKPDNSISEEEPEKPEPEIIDELNDEEEKKKQAEEKRRLEEELKRKRLEEAKRKKEERRRRIITISISIAFGMTMLIFGIQNWPLNISNNNPNVSECMTWADSLYVKVSCDEGPFSRYGTRVKPLDPMELKNMRKVEVHAAYKFFSEDNKPLIWYYKKSNKEIEYFTAPGLHPVTDETLRKITEGIIEKYVPTHINRKDSFLQ